MAIVGGLIVGLALGESSLFLHPGSSGAQAAAIGIGLGIGLLIAALVRE